MPSTAITFMMCRLVKLRIVEFQFSDTDTIVAHLVNLSHCILYRNKTKPSFSCSTDWILIHGACNAQAFVIKFDKCTRHLHWAGQNPALKVYSMQFHDVFMFWSFQIFGKLTTHEFSGNLRTFQWRTFKRRLFDNYKGNIAKPLKIFTEKTMDHQVQKICRHSRGDFGNNRSIRRLPGLRLSRLSP